MSLYSEAVLLNGLLTPVIVPNCIVWNTATNLKDTAACHDWVWHNISFVSTKEYEFVPIESCEPCYGSCTNVISVLIQRESHHFWRCCVSKVVTCPILKRTVQHLGSCIQNKKPRLLQVLVKIQCFCHQAAGVLFLYWEHLVTLYTRAILKWLNLLMSTEINLNQKKSSFYTLVKVCSKSTCKLWNKHQECTSGILLSNLAYHHPEKKQYST